MELKNYTFPLMIKHPVKHRFLKGGLSRRRKRMGKTHLELAELHVSAFDFNRFFGPKCAASERAACDRVESC